MGQRPAHLPDYLKAPAYLSPSPPLPASHGNGSDEPATDLAEGRLEPTRYGDWEKKGIAIDF
jgi:hypothetical protein